MVRKAKKSKNKLSKFWKSTLFVLLFIFVTSSAYGVYSYGLQKVLDEAIFYIIGATFTAIVITVTALFFKSKEGVLI